MKLNKLIGDLEYLRDTGILQGDTEVCITSDPDKDYDRTSEISIVVMRSKDKIIKEILLCDPASDIWKGMKKL